MQSENCTLRTIESISNVGEVQARDIAQNQNGSFLRIGDESGNFARKFCRRRKYQFVQRFEFAVVLDYFDREPFDLRRD